MIDSSYRQQMVNLFYSLMTICSITLYYISTRPNRHHLIHPAYCILTLRQAIRMLDIEQTSTEENFAYYINMIIYQQMLIVFLTIFYAFTFKKVRGMNIYFIVFAIIWAVCYYVGRSKIIGL